MPRRKKTEEDPLPERGPMVYKHMWICPLGRKKHPYRDGAEPGPHCCEVCNTPMVRHSWAAPK